MGRLATLTGEVSGAVAIDAVDVAYVGVDGYRQRRPLATAAGVAFERAPQVRSFPSFRGQRNNTGLWWSSTMDAHVGYESWLERDHLTLLDFDQRVVAVAAQPFWLSWNEAGRRRSHAPDFFARLRDGSGVVIDVRPASRIRPRDAAAFDVTARACAGIGWDYRLVHEPEPVRMANIRWLAGYRHPRCLRPGMAAAALTAFAAPRGLMDGAAAVADPVGVLPSVFHLLWHGRLRTDLTLPLSELSAVIAVPW